MFGIVLLNTPSSNWSMVTWNVNSIVWPAAREISFQTNFPSSTIASWSALSSTYVVPSGISSVTVPIIVSTSPVLER